LTDGQSSASQSLGDNGVATLRAYTDATREIMRVVSGSRSDEQPVFEAILESSSTLCRVGMCALFVVTEDPNTMVLAAIFGRELSAFEVGVLSISTDSNQNISIALRENRTIHTEDMRDSEMYRAGDPTRRKIVDAEGMRTQLVIPLFNGVTPIGGFVLFRSQVERFADEEIELLQTFADQAVIAIENARQFRELQTKLEHEAATRGLLSIISQSRDDEAPVFQMIVKSATRLCGSHRTRLVHRR
jgi:GAF domain-containing protein